MADSSTPVAVLEQILLRALHEVPAVPQGQRRHCRDRVLYPEAVDARHVPERMGALTIHISVGLPDPRVPRTRRWSSGTS
jgi:hypothetical protein|eukprot:SAG25_NODE_2219_length_1828_cov_1.128976_2_plen_80_part_00